jgi:ribosomal protein S18 acetylase RimI-like enzyme
MTGFLEHCEIVSLKLNQKIDDFDCGNEDLNDFFNQDAIKYQEHLLGQTSFFRHTETQKVICAFSLSPDSLHVTNLPNSRRKKIKEFIPYEKSLPSYPAFLIGRLGVALDCSRQGIGSQLMDFIKYYCSVKFPNLFRFLLVDAYNEPSVLTFYRKNDFQFVFSTEEQEREYYKRPSNTDSLRTRLMFYDMIHWKK